MGLGADLHMWWWWWLSMTCLRRRAAMIAGFYLHAVKPPGKKGGLTSLNLFVKNALTISLSLSQIA